MTNVTIEKRNNFEHIVGNEFTEVYSNKESSYELVLVKKEIQQIVDEYESWLNSNGHELDDQDKMNDIEATTNLFVGEYDFDCGDYTYYITIEENEEE